MKQRQQQKFCPKCESKYTGYYCICGYEDKSEKVNRAIYELECKRN